MIKRTLYFGNPAYLSTRQEQLEIKVLDTGETKTAPIEDIGVLILDHQQITITQALIAKLLANNTALITCDNTHHPVGLFLSLDGHSLQSRIFQAQLSASEPLKKQLWQQTVIAKIQNQAAMLAYRNTENKLLLTYAKDVKSGDTENMEAAAAGYYWKHLFPPAFYFTRDRYGMPPNNLLNYGYAILRAIVARSLVGSGLLPTLGIHHHNQYNAYCLADDIMEPYRPYVDKLVCEIIAKQEPDVNLTPGIKQQLLSIPVMDVVINGQKSPLMNAVQRTTSSLAKCFEGGARKLLYPAM
jgi:CRISP-associated protein Cas1